ncbi:MAG: low molecular weight phosphotyrosine protein phosphatase [Methylococcaceae bacterium]|nr:low molecular weight phosphotyrosine protein phosphatase [Methylococcaceae bacterium]
MQDSGQIAVLFVCMGNICRSPTAEGVFTKLVSERGLSHRFRIDSAGTHDYHVGKPPDRRAQVAAAGRGVDLSRLRARQVRLVDFDTFDYILVMDRENFQDLTALFPAGDVARVGLFLDYAPQLGLQEVPDPYYGGAQGFERVLDLVEVASLGFLNAVMDRR